MQPWSREFTGRLDELEIESEALRGNALGDPHVRPLWVYTPPGYDDEPERRYPCVFVIQGLTGQLDMWRNREPFRPNYPEMVDELFAGGEAPPTLVAFVDCWTSLGGSQFLNSPGTGRYQDFLCDEAVAFVRAGAPLGLHPLIGGLPPEIAWRYLRVVDEQVMPALRG